MGTLLKESADAINDVDRAGASPGTRRRRADGRIWVKQPDGSWIPEPPESSEGAEEKVEYRPTSPETFVKVRDAMMPAKYAGFVTTYSAEEYKEKGAKLHLSPTGESGYAITAEGDLISVFSKPGSGAGVELVKAAIRDGAKTLDCLGPFLSQFYARFGFVEHKRIAWDDQYAPPNWDYDKFDRPDVVMMRLEK